LAITELYNEKVAQKSIENNKMYKKLEYNRNYASLRTEIDMWDITSTTQDRHTKIKSITEKYTLHYKNYLNISFSDELAWAKDTFRSIDAIYVHSYLMAETLFRNLQKYLYNTDIKSIQSLLDSFDE